MRSAKMILRQEGSAAFPLLVARMGLKKVDETRESTAEDKRVTITWEADEGLRIVFTQDGLCDSEYVQVFGDDAEGVGGVAEALSDLGTYGYDDLLQAFRTADSIDEKAMSLIRVGVGAPPAIDEEFCDTIIEGLSSPETKLREAGLWAASYYALRKFVPFIQEIARTETDEDVAETAELMLQVYRDKGLE